MKAFKITTFIFTLSLFVTDEIVIAQSLTLNEAVAKALESNPVIKSVGRDVDKAKENVKIVRSHYLPQVAVAGAVNHYFQRPVFFGFGEQTGDKISYGRFGGSDQLAVAATLDQVLFNPEFGPWMRHAHLFEKQKQIELRNKQVEVVSKVKATYLEVLILNERLKLKDQNLERNYKALHDSRVLMAQGKALRVDTLRAYTAVKTLEPDKLKISNELEAAKLRLAALLGIDSATEIIPSDSLIIPIPKSLPEEPEVYAIALENNPRMQALVIQEALDQQEARRASLHRSPVVSLAGQYLLQSQTNSFDYSRSSIPPTSYLGLRLTVPVFTGLSLSSRIRQASLQQQGTTLLIENERNTLKADVHRLVSRHNETLERIAVAKAVNETAKLTFEIVQLRYKNGVTSRLELTDSELALTQAQSNYLEAIYDYLTTRIALLEIMGRAD